MKALREKALLAALVILALYAAVAGYWFMTLDRKVGWCPKTWGDAMRSYQKACDKYAHELERIGEKQKWEDAYEQERAAMPIFAEGLETDTTWQRKLDAFAAKHHISISETRPGNEATADEVHEVVLDVKRWEGALESLVQFLYELETTNEGMFDVPSLTIQPISNKPGFLKGSMTVTCAFMREK